MNDLSELFERIAWCRDEQQKLNEQIVTLSRTSVKHRIVNWNNGAGEAYATMLEKPPTKLRIEIGVVVNELRAILDALACTLATRNGANNIDDVSFPILKEKEGGFENIGRKRMRKLTQSDQDTIAGMRPWRADKDGNEGNLNLFLLHEADRTRKHQKLLQWACLGGVQPVSDGHVGFMSCGSTIFEEVGKEVALGHWNGVSCQLGVLFQLIYIEPPHLSGNPVDFCLSTFTDEVEKTVSAFA